MMEPACYNLQLWTALQRIILESGTDFSQTSNLSETGTRTGVCLIYEAALILCQDPGRRLII
jgi:hypothetical protein